MADAVTQSPPHRKDGYAPLDDYAVLSDMRSAAQHLCARTAPSTGGLPR